MESYGGMKIWTNCTMKDFERANQGKHTYQRATWHVHIMSCQHKSLGSVACKQNGEEKINMTKKLLENSVLRILCRWAKKSFLGNKRVNILINLTSIREGIRRLLWIRGLMTTMPWNYNWNYA